jgi:uncharacterized protein YhbP (UPF0306 family)
MDTDIERTIRKYIPQVVHMSLATCADGRPWVCEVHFSYDDALNLYFCSAMQTRHCTEIGKNPHVSGTIVTQHFLNQQVRGVYFEGVAEQLGAVGEDHPGFVSYTERLGAGPHFVQAAKAEGSARLYKIRVSDFYLVDGYDHQPPQKLHLPWNQ